MAKLAAKKKPTKPDAPKKPSSRSKTGNAECSQAASNWQLSIRGKATLNPGTYQTLAKCRALSKSGQMADAQGRTGKLSDQGAAALKGRLQSRFDSGLITQKSRNERLNMLLKQRSERGEVETAKTAAPTPARYSLGGKLAPGRGKDAPEYRDRLLKVLTKTQDRARYYELGRVDNPRVPNRTYMERGKELRTGIVANLRTAYNAEASKYVDQLHAQGKAVSSPVAAPKNTAEKISEESKKRSAILTTERNKNLESLKSGAIPLAWRVNGPKGFENIIIPSAEKQNMIVAAKPLGKSGRVAVQVLDQKGKYAALDVQGGYKLGGQMTMKGATRYGRAAEYLLTRAERKTGKKLSFSDLGKNKDLKPYFQTLRNIQSLPRLTY